MPDKAAEFLCATFLMNLPILMVIIVINLPLNWQSKRQRPWPDIIIIIIIINVMQRFAQGERQSELY